MPVANMVRSLTSSRAEEREWALRCDMAAVFRIGARLGWNEHIGNHNSLMLPDEPEPRFLINPRGYLFQELRASDLIVCDLEGRVLKGTGELRKVAFHIHCRIHCRSSHHIRHNPDHSTNCIHMNILDYNIRPFFF
jgi:ribulose-5-phosphate 4-epimerase/fuculose-1-phosphate aldolase